MSETITLRHPVTIGDGTLLDKVTLRRPTLGDIIAAKVTPGQQDIAGEARLVARLAGLHPEDVSLLDIADYLAVQGAMARFLAGDEA